MTASLSKPEIRATQRPNEKRRGPPWKLILQVVACQIAALLLVEAVLAWTGIGEEEIFRFDRELGFVHIPNKRITWRSEGFAVSHFDANGLREMGMTVAKPPNTVRVALLGDSLTEGLQVNYEDSFGNLIQKELGEKLQGKPVQVINFACSGYSTTQELLLLEKQVLSFKPDMVLVCYNHRDMIENWSTADQVVTNVRPSAVHLPGGWLFLDNLNVKLWFKSPRGRFLTSIAWLREHSRIWGVYSAAELQLSQKNPVAKVILSFWSQPKVVIKETRQQLTAWWQDLRKRPFGFQAPNIVTNKPAFSTAGIASKHEQFAMAAATTKPVAVQQPVQAVSVSSTLQRPSAEAECMDLSASTPLVPAALTLPAPETGQTADQKDKNQPTADLKTADQKVAASKLTAQEKFPEQKHADQKAAPSNVYGTVVFKTMDSLLKRMNEDCQRSGARLVVVAMPVRAVLCPTAEYALEFAGITYADEVAQLRASCRQQHIPFADVQAEAEKFDKPGRERLFYTAHLTPHGHVFTANALKGILSEQINLRK
jgi:lysophospholipase L1-like esterase